MELLELKKVDSNVLIATLAESSFISELIDIKHFSDYNRLLRVTAYVIRFTKNTRVKANKKLLGILSNEEMNAAKLLWFKDCQKDVKLSIQD